MEKPNPRNHPNHRERGPKRYGYTVADVAALAGLSIATVRLRQTEGKIRLGDLGSVVRFVAWRWRNNRTM